MNRSSAVPIEDRLEDLGFDGIEANFRCIMGLGPVPARACESILSEISDASSAPMLALKGKVLSNLGRMEEARAALSKAVALDASDARARSWLGQVYLLSGEFKAAVKELDGSIKLDPGLHWAYFYRAACRVGLGDVKGAKEDLGRIAGAKDAAAVAAQALGALLEGQEGRWDEALAAWGRVIKAVPKEGWPYALRARAQKLRGDLTMCLKDLKAALEAKPAGWIHMERSRVYEEMGDMARSVEEVDAALVLDGPQEDYFLRRAHLQICRRHYHLAVPDYTEALRLRPENVSSLIGRAMVECIRNNMEACVKDADRATAMAPDDPGVALERLRLRTYAGRVEGVDKELDELERAHPDLARNVSFLKGCYRMKTRSYEKAALEFEKGLSPARDTDFDRKIVFHQSIAKAFAQDTRPPGFKPVAPKTARLYICGLGIYPPYTASVETLRAVLSCDMVFNNLSEPEIAALLWLLAPECEPTMFDIRGADTRWTNAIFKHVTAGRTVGFVTRGHPLVCGGLAHSLIQECERRGDVEHRVFGSVSSVNTLAVRALPRGADAFWGLQVLDYSSVFSPNFQLDTRVPVVLYFNSTAMILTKEEHDRFCSIMESAYSKDQPVYFYGRTFNMTPELIKLSELRAYHQKIDPSYTLLIPPKDK
jgi:tetratricopeptide (TPR) repeat protein